MGQLALYLLALRANCEFVGGRKGDRLVSQLKRFLEDEKGAIGEEAWAAQGREGTLDSILECPHQSFGFSPQASFLPSTLPVLIFIKKAWACSRRHPESSLYCVPHAFCWQVLLLSHQVWSDYPPLDNCPASLLLSFPLLPLLPPDSTWPTQSEHLKYKPRDCPSSPTVKTPLSNRGGADLIPG